ncbi:MAG: glycosyltransferase family 39 protein [Deltaproteobacteria bacterium]|nr:glycosyltransferase family 39 protein [Deltaproteobacteria bacterium]MBW2417454.1 glycosyltransferase family 39 protein [Deltaproteobacteria bacterium]
MFERLLPILRARPRFAILAIVVAVGVAAFALPLVRRSLTLADEGYLLLQSLDMLHGKVLYRDLDAFVTPGLWFVLAGLFSLVEPSVIASRIPVFIAYLAMVGISYRIVALMAGWRAGLVAVALMLVCTVWAFPAWTFAFYSPFSVLFALAGLERLLVWSGGARGRDLVWSGVFFGIAIVFKQNYGAFALVGAAVGVVALHLERAEPIKSTLRPLAADAARMAVGVAAVGLPVFGYFVFQGVVPELFQSLLLHPFEFSGKHDISYLGLGKLFDGAFMRESVEMYTYAAQPVYRTLPPGGLVDEWRVIERLHVLMYWIPPGVFFAGAALALLPGQSSSPAPERPRLVNGRLVAVVAVCFFLFLGVFPRADFNHLINVYQGVVVAGVVVTHALLARLPQPGPLWLRATLGAAAAVFGLYAAVAGYWYYELMIRMDTPIAAKRGGVIVNEFDAAQIKIVLKTIDLLVPPGEALLTIPDLAMLNFLSGRPMPSAYYNLYEHHIGHDRGASVVEGAEAHGVNIALTRYDDFFSDRSGLRDYAPALVDYLETRFEITGTVGDEDYLVLRRRSAPVPLEVSSRLLEHCDTGTASQVGREHLFFDSLYHYPGIGLEESRGEVQTECRLRIPAEGAELVTRIGVREPAVVVEPGAVTMEIDLLRDGQDSERLLTQVFALQAKDLRHSYFPRHGEYRVDLSEHAGEEVTLVFRSIREGRVLVLYGRFADFGSVFEDLRIVPARNSGD